ncbi:MAG: hypothetical protein ACXVCP_04245 [Bdellovibrio sp.]
MMPFQGILAKNHGLNSVSLGQLIKVDASPVRGFNFAFFLYIPAEKAKQRSLIVIPNNSGSSAQDMEAQLWQAERQTLGEATTAEKTSSVLLVPGFPRPSAEPPIYTHSLSRNTLSVKDGPLKRIDLQLIIMTEAARELLKTRYKISLHKKFFLYGFSASAMFVNRFAFIHPKLVAGVALGAPGGWPLSPVKKYKDTALPYPVGIADLDDLTGEPIDLEAIKKVPFLLFLGDKDENDSVVYRDSYAKSDEEMIFSLFGKKPVERWPVAEKIYNDAGMNAKFKLYKELGHETNQMVREDVIKFFKAIKDEQ